MISDDEFRERIQAYVDSCMISMQQVADAFARLAEAFSVVSRSMADVVDSRTSDSEMKLTPREVDQLEAAPNEEPEDLPGWGGS